METTGVTIITGATSGIGFATAKILAKNKTPLALIARTQTDLDMAISKLNKLTTAHGYSCNIADEHSVKSTFTKIVKDFGSIQNLVTCAGMSYSKPVEEDTVEGFDEEVAVNLRGTYLCIMNSYKDIDPGGAIVNIATIRARSGTPTSSPGYAAAKAGVINLTKTFALQLAKYQIRVNCISPGAIYPTRLSEKWTQEKLKIFTEATPLKRVGTPDDIAWVIEFLLSSKASFITGQTIDVNGGIWMN